MKVIITGATGMVGEGVLLECLQNKFVEEVLIVNRRHYELEHAKLKELIVEDFLIMDEYVPQLAAYDGCFFCAGISSVGMKEEKYRLITYDTTLAFARVALQANPAMVFTYVSGAGTDTTEKGKLMWARVKGKTENTLAGLGFKAEYNFRPGVMMPYPGQKNWNSFYKVIGKLIKLFAPKYILEIQQVGRAMINAVQFGYPKNVLEVGDIRSLAERS